MITAGVINATTGSTPNHFLFQVGFRVSVDGAPLILPYPEPERATRDREEESIDLLYRAFPIFDLRAGVCQ